MTGEVTDEDLWHRSMPLALWQEAIKLYLDLGKGGKRCLMIDSAFSDNAHATMQPRSVGNKDTALKICLNYRTLRSQNGAG